MVVVVCVGCACLVPGGAAVPGGSFVVLAFTCAGSLPPWGHSLKVKWHEAPTARVLAGLQTEQYCLCLHLFRVPPAAEAPCLKAARQRGGALWARL